MARMSLPTPTLHTARLRLRPFDDADADDLFALHSNAYVLRYWDAPPWSEPSRSGRFMRARNSRVVGTEWPPFGACRSMRGPRETRRRDHVGKFEGSGGRRFSVLEQCPSRHGPSDIVDSGVSRRKRKAGGRRLPESNKSLDRKMTRIPDCDRSTADREGALGPLRSARRHPPAAG